MLRCSVFLYHIYSIIRRFAYKTGPIFTWKIVNILFRLVYKMKKGKQVTRETHFSIKVRLCQLLSHISSKYLNRLRKLLFNRTQQISMQVIKFTSLQFYCCRCLQAVSKTAPQTIHYHRGRIHLCSLHSMTFNLITAYMPLIYFCQKL